MTVENKQAIEQVNDAAEISLVDIEDLRRALGAEANVADAADLQVDASYSTVMCPVSPWDK